MSVRRRRILIGRLFHESHSFNPRPTDEAGFRVQRGPALLSDLGGSTSILAGIARRLGDLQDVVVPSVSAVAAPGGLVDHRCYLALKDELIAAAGESACEAVALELHGAMATDALADAEGDLLTDLRAAVGPAVPIGIGLDLHGHVTPAMLEAVDICIACKENPHADLFQCGERVVDCLHAMLEGRLRPVTSLVKVPVILTGAAETASGPLAEIHGRARQALAAEPALWDVSILNVFPFADDAGMGQAVLALTDGEAAPGQRIAEALGELLWSWRDRFRDQLPDIAAALDLVAAQPAARPFAIADMGDRVLAGAPGDSTAILAAALAHPDRLLGAVPVTDPEAAAKAIAAGVGRRITLAVGGRFTPGFVPLEITGDVVSATDGRFIMKGPYQAGEVASLGATAVVRVGSLSVILTSLPGPTQDPAAFESQGIDIAAQDFLVVKSGYHFKLSFDGIATPLMVETPGIARYRPGFFSWQRARVHPAHPVAFDRAPALVFDRMRQHE
ncbi:MAG TPA: M81 family metallopeptidase [Kiloniellaceae bacterium]